MKTLNEEDRQRIVIDEKLRLSRIVSRMSSMELDMILDEESPLRRRAGFLETAFEVLLGAYVGILSILAVLIITVLFS